MSRNILANSVLNAASGLTLLITGFACSIAAARLLGPEANGVIAFSLWLAATGALVAELGTGVMLLRFLPQLKVQGADERQRRGFAAYLLWPVVLSTLVLAVVYFLVFGRLNREHWLEMAPAVVVVTGVLFLVQSIGAFAKNYLIGEQELGSFFRLTVIASAMQLAGVLGGALLYGVNGALAGYVLGQAALFAYTMRILATKPDPQGMRAGTLASSSLLLSVQYIVASIFLTRFELLFLQKYHDVEIVGFYAVALSLANLALQLPLQLTGSLLPYYAEKLEHSGGRNLPVSVFEGVVRSLSYITLPMSFGLAAIAGELVTAVFGEEFRPAGRIVAVLALSAPVFVFAQVCTQYLFSQGRIRERLLIDLAAAVLLTSGALALVPAFGGTGAAVARGLTFLAMGIAMARIMEFDGSMKGLLLPLATVALASAACGLVAFATTRLLPGPAGLPPAIVAGAAVYVTALRLLKAVPPQDAEALTQIASRLPGRLRRATGALAGFVSPQARGA